MAAFSMVESELVSVNYKVKMAKKKLRYKEKQPYFYGNGQKNNDESASIDRRVSNIESSTWAEPAAASRATVLSSAKLMN